MQSASRVPLSDRQLTPALIQLQKAAAVLHRRAQRIQTLRMGISYGLAVAGIVTTVIRHTSAEIALLGLLWSFVLTVAISPWLQRQHGRAVLVQEMFDCQLFQLPWRHALVGEKLQLHDIHRLAQRLRPATRRGREILEGWYVDTRGIPPPYDVLLCQLENAGWDIRLRRRYGGLAVLCGLFWSIGGIAVGAVLQMTINDILLYWYVPSLGAATLTLQIIVDQYGVISEKERLLKIVNDVLSIADAAPLSDRRQRELLSRAREIQDGLFVSRKRTLRAPRIMYRVFRSVDEEDFRAHTDSFRERIDALS
jgi:hypothetical protein